jgi:CDGSH iron-sulfur domain-containing protein 3
MTDEEAIIAQKAPYAVAVEAEKSYWYCTCGRTESELFAMESIKVRVSGR